MLEARETANGALETTYKVSALATDSGSDRIAGVGELEVWDR
jgi:hypothetical protein